MLGSEGPDQIVHFVESNGSAQVRCAVKQWKRKCRRLLDAPLTRQRGGHYVRGIPERAGTGWPGRGPARFYLVIGAPLRPIDRFREMAGSSWMRSACRDAEQKGSGFEGRVTRAGLGRLWSWQGGQTLGGVASREVLACLRADLLLQRLAAGWPQSPAAYPAPRPMLSRPALSIRNINVKSTA